MNIRDPLLLDQILTRHGQPEGHEIDCFGTLDDPSDFVYFKIYPDRLRIRLHRVLSGVAAFDFHFVLHHDAGGVVVERIVQSIEGGNKRIRAALGEAYAKTSIGVPFTDLSGDEEAWVAMALRTFRKYWMT
jgi:hypothetical protein